MLRPGRAHEIEVQADARALPVQELARLVDADPVMKRVRVSRAVSIGSRSALVHAAVVLTVVVLDYTSESQKLARGAYTDTFSPMGFARLASAPLSLAAEGPRYPDGPFNEHAYRAVIGPALPTYLLATGVQTVVLGLIVGLVVTLRTPREARG